MTTQEQGEQSRRFLPHVEILATDFDIGALDALLNDELFEFRLPTAVALLHDRVYPELSIEELTARMTKRGDVDQRRGAAFNLANSFVDPLRVQFEPLRWIHGKLLGDIYAVNESGSAINVFPDEPDQASVENIGLRTVLGLDSDHESYRSFAILEPDETLRVNAVIATVPSGTYEEMGAIDPMFVYEGIVFRLMRAAKGETDQ